MKILLTLILITFTLTIKGQQKTDYSLQNKEEERGVNYIKLIEGYKIWTQKVGNGKIIILLIHGSGNNHHCFEIFKNKLNLEKYQLIFYDQLGSNFSDKPDDVSLYNIERFVEEVEQLRIGLELEQFYILGHSWGGALAMEYAIKYPTAIRGLIISNKGYSQSNLYKRQSKLWNAIALKYESGQEIINDLENGKQVSDTLTLKKIDLEYDSRYVKTIQPPPLALINSKKNNRRFYIANYEMWDIYDKLHLIRQPTLLIGGDRDFVDKEEIFKMKDKIGNSQVFICPIGAHFSFWDDSLNYFNALEKFIEGIEPK